MKTPKIQRYIYITKWSINKEKYWRKFKVVRVLIDYQFLRYNNQARIIYVLENCMYLTEIYPGNLKIDIGNWAAGGYSGEDTPEHFYEILEQCQSIFGLKKPPRDIDDIYFNALAIKKCIENDEILGERNVLNFYKEYKEKTK